MRKIVDLINTIYNKAIALGVSYLLSKKELGDIIKKSGKKRDCLKIDEWRKKWSVLGHVNRDYYRVFAKYSGEDINIVPDDICHNIIEPILNPKRYISVYEDKCMFDKMLWSSFHKNVTPATYIKNIEGSCYDINYNPIDSLNKVIDDIPADISKLIIKRSIDSSSGRGIVFIHRDKNGVLVDSSTNEVFSEQYLNNNFGQNYVVQKVMEQSPFMEQFCKTSVNTIRLAVYRSVKTNTPSVINAIIRIGKDGSLVDNAHAGGMFVGVDKDGIIGKYACNQYGEISSVFNGNDFAANRYQIPNYEKIKRFAEMVASALPHHRLLALDIMLDKDNEPVLLEYNIRAFSVWLFQFTNGAGFGEFTDEIIDYCQRFKDNATRIFVSF